MIMLLIVAAVVFAYYGGASCPKVLKDNKQMLLGVVVGLLLGSFFGVRIEGFEAHALGGGNSNPFGSLLKPNSSESSQSEDGEE